MAETTTTQPQEVTAPQPQKEHQWLQKLVGEWRYEGEASMGPGAPAQKMSGTATVRNIGELWIQIEGQAESPADTSLMTLGYDPEKKRFAGTFVSGMSTYLWVYDGGSLDGDKLTLPAEGPSMTGDGGTGQYRDVIEQVSGDHFTLSSFTPDEKGGWQHFMTMHYHRK